MSDLHLPPSPPELDPGAVRVLIDKLVMLRLEAKELARSGNPALRAEGKRGVQECNEHLAALRKLLGKEEPSAEL